MPRTTGKLRVVNHSDFKIGWICAIQKELDAARAALDEEFSLPRVTTSAWEQGGSYIVGRIDQHNIVIACVENARNVGAAAKTAIQLKSAFENVRLGFMVGIGGGVTYWGDDIRLGDVVVSKPDNGSGGIIAWDGGKDGNNDFSYRGHYAAPPDRLLAADNEVRSRWRVKDHDSRGAFRETMESINRKLDPPTRMPALSTDVLRYAPDVSEAQPTDVPCPKVWDIASGRPKDGEVDPETGNIRRDARPDRIPVIHRGVIASGGSVMGNARKRDMHVKRIHKHLDLKAVCFEMEAAALVNNLPCLIVRGISDYADEHKNDEWQDWAALSAAAYAKVLITSLDSHREGGGVLSVMTDEERTMYEKLFRLWDSTDSGLISGELVCQSFRKSGLHDADLQHIYNLADVHGRGSLNKHEYLVAMHLIYCCRKGELDPVSSPADFSAVAAKNFEALV